MLSAFLFFFCCPFCFTISVFIAMFGAVAVCVCLCVCVWLRLWCKYSFYFANYGQEQQRRKRATKKERKEAEQTTRTTSATGNDVYGPPFWPLAAILCNFFCAEPPLPPHTVTAASESFFQVVPRVI